MPLFDFQCRGCGREFEALIRPQDAGPPSCPACQGIDLEKLLPTFAVSSAEKTRAAATVKRRKEASTARRDNVAKEREIEKHLHEDH